jgi:high affinity Mn2+ porin
MNARKDHFFLKSAIITILFLSFGFQSAQADQETEETPSLGLMHSLAKNDLHDLKNETWNLYGQYTYIQFWKPAFHAPYTNTNGSNSSLKPGAEDSFSQTVTLFASVRPWHGGEMYYAPEMIVEKTMSQLKGLGGTIQNFELQKTGGPAPQFYESRLFLRQTVEFGGEKIDLPSGQMQLGKKVDQRRLVVTAGNFSQLDVFDKNNVIGDLRRSFLNEAFMTNSAYDFPADARGYSVGVTLEFYWDNWVLRLARLMPPKKPNEQSLDSRFFQFYGDTLELEHNHTWNGQPGTLRLLAYRNSEFMGKFSDAISAYQADPSKNAAACGDLFNYGSDNATAPDFCWVRKTNIKMGAGINFEQNINADVGVFLRAMYSDGQAEVDAYNSADRSATLGTILKGTKWRRPQDALGVGLGISAISDIHAQYLAMGGVDAFIGDGHLNKASEDLAEIFYSFNVIKSLWVSADYQRIWHPGYNGDRGPVNFYGSRVHAEF